MRRCVNKKEVTIKRKFTLRWTECEMCGDEIKLEWVYVFYTWRYGCTRPQNATRTHHICDQCATTKPLNGIKDHIKHKYELG